MAGEIPQGPPTSPVTLRPKTYQGADREQSRDEGAEKALLEKAAFLGLLGSNPGQAFIDLVSSKLMKRIGELVHNDPEARALKGILEELDSGVRVAEKALEELYLKRLKREREADSS